MADDGPPVIRGGWTASADLRQDLREWVVGYVETTPDLADRVDGSALELDRFVYEDGEVRFEAGDSERVGPFYYVGEEGFEAWGFAFPSGFTILEWVRDSVPDDETTLQNHHQSVYHSVEDFRSVCTGRVDWGISPEQFDRPLPTDNDSSGGDDGDA